MKDYHYCSNCSTTEDHTPNVPLHAAAPALLEALELYEYALSNDFKGSLNEAQHRGRAAIAQAKGESNA